MMMWMHYFFMLSSSEGSKRISLTASLFVHACRRPVNSHLPGDFPGPSSHFLFFTFLTRAYFLSLWKWHFKCNNLLGWKQMSFHSSITSKLRRPSNPHRSELMASPTEEMQQLESISIAIDMIFMILVQSEHYAWNFFKSAWSFTDCRTKKTYWTKHQDPPTSQWHVKITKLLLEAAPSSSSSPYEISNRPSLSWPHAVARFSLLTTEDVCHEQVRN